VVLFVLYTIHFYMKVEAMQVPFYIDLFFSEIMLNSRKLF